MSRGRAAHTHRASPARRGCGCPPPPLAPPARLARPTPPLSRPSGRGHRGRPRLPGPSPSPAWCLPGASSLPGLCPEPVPAVTKLRFSGVCLHAPLQCFGSRPWHWSIRFLVLPDILHGLGSPSLTLARLARQRFISLLGCLEWCNIIFCIWLGTVSLNFKHLFVRF